MAKFSLATNEKFKDRNDQWQERTEWHNIVAWQRLAEIVGEFVAKGTKIYIEGKLQTSCWETAKVVSGNIGLRLSFASLCFSVERRMRQFTVT